MGWESHRLLLLSQLLLVPCVIGIALETPVPERFLPPRNFNPHPITDVIRSQPKVDHYRPINIPAASDIYAHYTQHRQPAYKDREYRQYATLEQQLAYNSNVEDYITHAHHHQEFDPAARVRPLVSGTASYELVAPRTYHHEQYSGHSENPSRHFTQVTHHSHGGYTSKSVQHRSDTFTKKPYSFAYSVLDDASGDDFSHHQAHNGQATQGEYRVKLPDGRTQVVRYTADHGGYRADVSYEPTAPVAAPLLLHVTPSPLYQHHPAEAAAAAGVVKNAFYGGQAIPGPKATPAAAADIQPAHLAFEQHLVYKRSQPGRAANH